MPKITLTFEGESWTDVENQIRAVMGFEKLDPDAAVFSDEPPLFSDERESVRLGVEPPPAFVMPKGARGRKARPMPNAPEPPAPEPAPPPTAPPAPEPELPPLDALKAFITQAVRAGQKGEGPQKINDLLPAFKQKTGLDFVMNAEEKHRRALHDLAVEAGLA